MSDSIDQLIFNSMQKAFLSKPFAEMLEKAIAKANNIQQPNDVELDKYLTPEQVEKMFDIAPATRWKWEKKGSLPTPLKIGGRLYYLKKEVLNFTLNQRKVQ